MKRELQCICSVGRKDQQQHRCSVGRKDQQQHKCIGSCSVDGTLGERTNNNTDAEEGVVWMQCWEKGPATTWMHRELSYRCSTGSGRTMGSSSVEDVGQGGLALAQVPMSDDQSNTQ